MTISNIIANNIDYILLHNGMAMGKFEENIGIQPGYISRCRNGKVKKLSIDVVVKAAKELNIPIDELISSDYINKRREADIKDEIKMLELELNNIRKEKQ